VQGIIFLASLADYCQVLFEDANVNRMHESLNLFGEVTKNPAFEKTPLFVFLNKKDLFESSIRVKVRDHQCKPPRPRTTIPHHRACRPLGPCRMAAHVVLTHTHDDCDAVVIAELEGLLP
jgi:hypothetical protein